MLQIAVELFSHFVGAIYIDALLNTTIYHNMVDTLMKMINISAQLTHIIKNHTN